MKNKGLPHLPEVSRRTLMSSFAGGALLSGVEALPAVAAAPAPGKPFRIWDVHSHIISGGKTPEERAARLLEYADRVGIERLVLSLGSPLEAFPSPQNIRDTNDQVMLAVKRWPKRVVGFVYLSPNQVETSLQEFDRCVRDGPLIGVKLWCGGKCNAPQLDPIVERATAYNVPILQHTWFNALGNQPGESTPSDLAELGRRHPNARLIGAHSGGDWERGFRAVRSVKNVCVDVCGFDPTGGAVEMAVRELGAERVLYGSDSGGRSFASQLAKVMGAEIPDAAKSLILGGNLRRLLTPFMQKKGYEA